MTLDTETLKALWVASRLPKHSVGVQAMSLEKEFDDWLATQRNADCKDKDQT